MTNSKFSLTDTPNSSITYSSILCVFEIPFALMSQNSNIVCDMIYVWKIKIYLESVITFPSAKILSRKGDELPYFQTRTWSRTFWNPRETGYWCLRKCTLYRNYCSHSLKCINMASFKLHRQQLCSLFTTFGLWQPIEFFSFNAI